MKIKSKRIYLTFVAIVIAIVSASSNGYAIDVDNIIGVSSANMVIPTSTYITETNPAVQITGDRSYNYGGPSNGHKRYPEIEPTNYPTSVPTIEPTNYPTSVPTIEPTNYPTSVPTIEPTNYPTSVPTKEPTNYPTKEPTNYPTNYPTSVPTIDNISPTIEPTNSPISVIPPTSVSTIDNGTIVNVAGFRSSDYGGPADGNTYGHGQTDSAYWVSVAKQMSAKFPGSSPGAQWVVGYIETPETSTFMPFPAPSGYKGMHDVTFSNKNGVEEDMLTAFDNAGMKVILQVEPGDADVSQLATMILNKFKNHPSVVGFGVDTEWLNAWTYKDGRPATDTEIQTWLNAVRAVNPNYKLLVKHWLPSHLGSGHIEGVTYVTDTLELGSYKAALNDYVAWANNFKGSEIGYQIGYEEDMNWWLPMADPSKSIITDIKTKVPSANIYSVYFVDFAITKEFPTEK